MLESYCSTSNRLSCAPRWPTVPSLDVPCSFRRQWIPRNRQVDTSPTLGSEGLRHSLESKRSPDRSGTLTAEHGRQLESIYLRLMLPKLEAGLASKRFSPSTNRLTQIRCCV